MKKLVVKLFLLFLIVLLLQIADYYVSGGDKKFYPGKIEEIHSIFDANPDVIYMGDSVLTSVSSKDVSKLSIPEMLQNILVRMDVRYIQSDAFHAQVYSAIVKNMTDRKVSVKHVVVPINLRSFSPVWDMRPEYQFRKEIVLLNNDSLWFRIAFDPLAVFKTFNLTPVSREDYVKQVRKFSAAAAEDAADFVDEKKYEKATEENIKNKFIFHYMGIISGTHRKLEALGRTAELLKENGINVIMYITPVDYEQGEHYLGSRFKNRIQANINCIKTYLAACDADVLDLSQSLPSSCFDWKKDLYPNEHLNEKGRRFVAGKIASLIGQ